MTVLQPELEGTEWRLAAFAGPAGAVVPVPAGIIASAVFAVGVVSGSTGCNRYHAPYRLDGTALEIGPAAMTMMACEPERAEVERAFTASLAQARAWALAGEELELRDGEGRTTLRFRAAIGPALVGTEWVAIGINNGRGGVASALEGVEVTATFGDDGRVTGSGGCNRFFGPFALDGESVVIGPLATTRKLRLEPAGVGEQEAAFLAALGRVATWSIREDRLQLRAADGALQVDFRPAVDSWWAQAITVGFERARGLRAAHQVVGGFSIGVSRTFPVPVERLWAAFADEAGRSSWLEPGLLRERTAQPGRTARFDVAGGPSRMNVSLTAKGDAKASVTIQHERLASAAEVEEQRAFWRSRLAALGELLAAGTAGSASGTPAGSGSPAGSGPGTPAGPGSPAGSGPGTPAGPLAELLVGVDAAKAGLIVELDRLVRAAAPELDVAVKYRMLTYAIGRNWWRWVVAIGVTKQAVNLRLLYGTRLESGTGVLRPGSSHLATLDLLPGAPLDAGLVARLVREAVERHAEFLAAEGAAR
jgi:heat shock protein HslJ